EQMGVNDSLDRVSKNICPAHRLLYFLGHDQRLKDSVLRVPPQEMGLEHLPDRWGQRPVTAVARIDGNSLGILFVERHEEDFEEESLQDRRRRRSFRFNAHWWHSLRSAVDHTGTGDLVAAWVTAGDDVILAEYSPQDGGFPKGERLRETLEIWAERLEEFNEELDDQMGLSFGAGLAVKRGEKISPQLKRAEHYEKTAKNRWKTMMEGRGKSGKPHPMLTRLENGKPVEIDWTRDNNWQNCTLGNTNSIVVEEKGGRIPTLEDEESVHPEFQEWTEELIERIAEGNDLIRDDREMWGVLKRHYIEEKGGKKTLRVLIPHPVKMLVPVGKGSRGNILQACKIKGVAEIHLLLTRSVFPDDESAQRLIESIGGLIDHPPIRWSSIDGPEAGPVGCRNSIQEWREENDDYVPDHIFVTGSTLLIVASLSYIFPSAGLVALRGPEVFRLPEEELISTLENLEIDAYLTLHGMELTKSKKLKMNGTLLEAPPLTECKMIGSRASLTWFCKSLPKEPSQLIGASIRDIVESVGIGPFAFNAFGFGPLMENASDPKVVNTIPNIHHFREEGIEAGTELRGVSPFNTNLGRGLFKLGRGLVLVGELKTGSEISKLEKFDIRATGEITPKGRMTMALIKEEEEE
ncbi:uncharacterized protein METZ01_LOCUS88425, partial [marine metagenome]